MTLPPIKVIRVITTAIPEDNPELVAARERGAPVLHRSELLAEIAGLKRSISVAGAHGETTTASMAAHVSPASPHPRSGSMPPASV